jgi:hypothetical protein
MSYKILKTTLSLIFLVALFFCWNGSLSAQSEDVPVIHLKKTSHTLPPVFEGETLSYAFTVFNKGRSDLQIEKVAHS